MEDRRCALFHCHANDDLKPKENGKIVVYDVIIHKIIQFNANICVNGNR